MRLPLELIPELERIYSKYWWKEDEELNYEEVVADPFKNLIILRYYHRTHPAITQGEPTSRSREVTKLTHL